MCVRTPQRASTENKMQMRKLCGQLRALHRVHHYLLTWFLFAYLVTLSRVYLPTRSVLISLEGSRAMCWKAPLFTCLFLFSNFQTHLLNLQKENELTAKEIQMHCLIQAYFYSLWILSRKAMKKKYLWKGMWRTWTDMSPKKTEGWISLGRTSNAVDHWGNAGGSRHGGHHCALIRTAEAS